MLSLRYVPILALHLTLVTDPSEYRTNIIPSFSIRYFVGLRAYTAKATSKTSCDANECIKVRFLSDSRVYNLICIYVPNLTTRLKKIIQIIRWKQTPKYKPHLALVVSFVSEHTITFQLFRLERKYALFPGPAFIILSNSYVPSLTIHLN